MSSKSTVDFKPHPLCHTLLFLAGKLMRLSILSTAYPCFLLESLIFLLSSFLAASTLVCLPSWFKGECKTLFHSNRFFDHEASPLLLIFICEWLMCLFCNRYCIQDLLIKHHRFILEKCLSNLRLYNFSSCFKSANSRCNQ